eukprot:9470082-Pyramimonas_sp.AAC.2
MPREGTNQLRGQCLYLECEATPMCLRAPPGGAPRAHISGAGTSGSMDGFGSPTQAAGGVGVLLRQGRLAFTPCGCESTPMRLRVKPLVTVRIHPSCLRVHLL